VKSGCLSFNISLKRQLIEVMTLTSFRCIFMQTSLCQLWQRNKTKLILLFCLSVLIVLIADDSLAKAKRVLTGDDLELFDAWIKSKDGTQYGFGVTSPEDMKWLFRLVVAQAIVMISLALLKIWEWSRSDKTQEKRERQEQREAWLKVVGDVQYIKQNMMTSSQVSDKVREEIKYLREHGSFLESPGRRSGSRDG
jgi:hypothetical protein